MNEADFLRSLDDGERTLQAAYLDQITASTRAINMAEVERLVRERDELGLREALYVGAFIAYLDDLRAIYIKAGRAELASIPKTQLSEAFRFVFEPQRFTPPEFRVPQVSTPPLTVPRPPQLLLPAPPRPLLLPAPAMTPAVKAAVQNAVRRFEFDVRSYGAEQWLRANSDDLLERFAAAQAEAISKTLTAATMRGETPRKVAERLVGKPVSPSGPPKGGVVGLAGNDVDYVETARLQLMSNDPKLMREYLRRTRRDGRFDKTVERAITTGEPIPPAKIDQIIMRYADRLLITRAEMIARTTALETVGAASAQVYQQLVDQGVPASRIVKGWQTRGDERVRVSHASMQGQKAAFGEPFIGPGGSRLQFPGDASLGAPMSMRANCRCRCKYSVKGLMNRG